jgi:hypothetical protein
LVQEELSEEQLREELDRMTKRALSRRRWAITVDSSVAMAALRDAEGEIVELKMELARVRAELDALRWGRSYEPGEASSRGAVGDS